MIVIDLETSGLFADKNGVWQIGAIDLENPEDTFLDECRIDDEDSIEKDSLEITGMTEEKLRDKKKQSQKELLKKFFDWVKKKKQPIMISQNPQVLDFPCLFLRAKKYGLDFPINYRVLDLHTAAQIKYFEVHGKFLTKLQSSDMGLKNILKFAGMTDNRGVHNALEDARLTAEAFSRIVYGKSIFKEYAQFKIPEYLKK